MLNNKISLEMISWIGKEKNLRIKLEFYRSKTLQLKKNHNKQIDFFKKD